MSMTTQQAAWIVHRAKTHIDVNATGCHIWRGVKNQAGYGLIEYRDKVTKKRVSLGIHRIYYSLINNIELIRSDFVCHSCDTPSCVNIKHLFLGNAKINSDDKIKKKRYAKKIKYHHRNCKYTEDEIQKAKALLRSGESTRSVMEKTGFKQTYVNDLNWGRLKREDNVQYPLSIPRSFKGFNAGYTQGRIVVKK